MAGIISGIFINAQDLQFNGRVQVQVHYLQIVLFVINNCYDIVNNVWKLRPWQAFEVPGSSA